MRSVNSGPVAGPVAAPDAEPDAEPVGRGVTPAGLHARTMARDRQEER